jgi:hypothetical protein
MGEGLGVRAENTVKLKTGPLSLTLSPEGRGDDRGHPGLK